MSGKLRYMDSRPDEQERGITMKSSAISLVHTRNQPAEKGNRVIGNWKPIESTTITNYIWWLALLRIRVIGNVVDSITEPEKTKYNYFL